MSLVGHYMRAEFYESLMKCRYNRVIDITIYELKHYKICIISLETRSPTKQGSPLSATAFLPK